LTLPPFKLILMRNRSPFIGGVCAECERKTVKDYEKALPPSPKAFRPFWPLQKFGIIDFFCYSGLSLQVKSCTPRLVHRLQESIDVAKTGVKMPRFIPLSYGASAHLIVEVSRRGPTFGVESSRNKTATGS